MKLNIGCATNLFPGWLNVDRENVEETYLKHLRPLKPEQVESWPDEQVRHVRALAEGRLRFFQWDLRKGFPMYADGSIDAIYNGQCIEHLQPNTEAPAFLAECFRMLRQGGAIKLTTPDLDKLIRDYAPASQSLAGYAPEQPAYFKGALPEDQLAYIMYGAGGTDDRYEGHQHLYTQRSLTKRLEAAGFIVMRNSYLAHDLNAHGITDAFNDCIDKGMSHSFALIGVKP